MRNRNTKCNSIWYKLACWCWNSGPWCPAEWILILNFSEPLQTQNRIRKNIFTLYFNHILHFQCLIFCSFIFIVPMKVKVWPPVIQFNCRTHILKKMFYCYFLCMVLLVMLVLNKQIWPNTIYNLLCLLFWIMLHF